MRGRLASFEKEGRKCYLPDKGSICLVTGIAMDMKGVREAYEQLRNYIRGVIQLIIVVPEVLEGQSRSNREGRVQSRQPSTR